MKEKLLIVILLFCFSLVFCEKATLSEPSKFGLTAGDFSCYKMFAVFTSSDPYAIIDVPYYEKNNTDWVRIDISEVSGSVIHQVYTLYFANKSETFKLKTDIDPDVADVYNFSNLGIPICAANLEVGDAISITKLTVEETLIRIYPSGERKTNHVSWNSSVDYGDCYFDKKTGFLVELNRTHLYVNPASDEVIKKVDIIKMTNSSFWFVSDSQMFLVLNNVVLGIILSAFLYTYLCYRRPKICRRPNEGDKLKCTKNVLSICFC